MSTHFLFQEGEWIGQGRICFTVNPEEIPFDIHWTVASIDKNRFRAVQRVEMEDQDPIINIFTITRQPAGQFQLYLENEILGVFSGDGLYDTCVAWEFAHYGVLEGLEVYEKRNEDDYSFRAEYLGNDGTVTTVRGAMSKAA